jgi:RNA polymerase sigma-70 factor, ECF subfamily
VLPELLYSTRTAAVPEKLNSPKGCNSKAEIEQRSVRGEVTELLLEWGEGKQSALHRLIPLLYPRLHRLARGFMRGEREGHLLQTSALVNEVYVRLVNAARVNWRDRAHFLAISAQLMRRILVDFARTRRAHKRGEGIHLLPLDAALDLHQVRSRELLKLDDALNELAALDPRKAKVIEMRFFGGLSVEESAAVLGVSPDTVLRDWRLARAWLHRTLSEAAQSG